jgi:acetoacetate decarboxylase
MQIPVGSDLYEELPRPYRNVRWLSVYCEADTVRLSAVIPAPLQPQDPQRRTTPFEVFIAHYGDTPYGPYTEAGVIVPCRYKDLAGQTFAPFLYLDQVGPIVGGRELMGFPKKDATVRFEQTGEVIRGGVARGKAHLEFEGRPSAAAQLGFEPLPSGPRLLVREFPRADGPGYVLREVLRKDADPQAVVRVTKPMDCTLRVAGTPDDPLDILQPFEVKGGRYRELDMSLRYAQVLESDFRGAAR